MAHPFITDRECALVYVLRERKHPRRSPHESLVMPLSHACARNSGMMDESQK